MKTVVITGANGFLGQRLTMHLIGKGIRVICLIQRGCDRTPFRELPDEDVIEFDLTELSTLAPHLPQEADAFYHLAWKGVSTTMKNDLDVQLGNIGHAVDALRLSSVIRCRRFVCPGSMSEYAYGVMPVRPDSLPSPADLYGATKVAVHQYCDVVARQLGQPINWVVIPSVYGPGRNDANLVTYAIRTLLTGGRPVFTRLEQLWDYLYVDDLMEAFRLIPEKGAENQTYVVGSGTWKPLRDYVEIIRQLTAPDAPLGIGEVPYKSDRVDHSIADVSKLTEDTGFQAAIDFETGIRRTIAYFREELRMEGEKEHD